MGKLNLAVMKERIAAMYDPDYVVDILDISTEELLDRFEDKLLEKMDEWAELENPE